MLKKTIVFVFVITLFSCKNDVKKDYATFSGKIINPKGSDGSLQKKDFKKEIKISKDGVFSDTIHLADTGEILYFSDGNEYTQVYLKNGYDIHLTLDTKEFDETVKYKGKGAPNSNYLAEKSLMKESLLTASLFDLDKVKFKKSIDEIVSKFDDKLAHFKGLDTDFITSEKEELSKFKEGLLKEYNMVQAEKEKFNSFIGKPSPNFESYENYKGGTTSLKDLKGKYLYVDVWATWCGPCKAEIPFLKKLEEEYKDKNITFLSISIDDGSGYKDRSKELAKKGWKAMIAEKQMKGVQLYADNGWKSTFVRGYKIDGIPRFIIIDPKGNVVDANTSRPSSPKTKELLNKLLK